MWIGCADPVQHDPVPRGQQLEAADPGDHGQLESTPSCRDGLDDPDRRVVEGRVAPDQEADRAVAAHLVGDDRRVRAEPGPRARRRPPTRYAAVSRSRSGPRAGRAPRRSGSDHARSRARQSSARSSTRSCFAAPLSATRNTSTRFRAATASRVRCIGLPLPIPMTSTCDGHQPVADPGPASSRSDRDAPRSRRPGCRSWSRGAPRSRARLGSGRQGEPLACRDPASQARRKASFSKAPCHIVPQTWPAGSRPGMARRLTDDLGDAVMDLVRRDRVAPPGAVPAARAPSRRRRRPWWAAARGPSTSPQPDSTGRRSSRPASGSRHRCRAPGPAAGPGPR